MWREHRRYGNRSTTSWRETCDYFGQRQGSEECSWAQDGRIRRGVAGEPAATRTDKRKLHTSPPVRELRELTRYRTSLIRQRAAEKNRLQKALEDANIKLASGNGHKWRFGAGHARGTYRQGQRCGGCPSGAGQVEKQVTGAHAGLEGLLGPYHRLTIAEILALIDYLDKAVAHISSALPLGE